MYLRTIPSLLNWFNHFYYLFFNFFSSFLKSSFSLFSFLCLYIPFSSVYKLSLIRCPIIYNTFFFLLLTATFLYCFILCKNKIYLKILFIFQMKPSEKFINSFDYSLSSSTIYIKSSCDVSLPHTTSHLLGFLGTHLLNLYSVTALAVFSSNVRSWTLKGFRIACVDFVVRAYLVPNRSVESVIGCGVGSPFLGQGSLLGCLFLSSGQGSCLGAAPYFRSSGISHC